MVDRPLQVVTACRARDLPVLELAAARLPECVPFDGLTVLAPEADCELIRARLGRNANVVSEEGFIPGLRLEDLRGFKLPGFPAGAGWYYQQFLKLQYAFVDPEDDFYLVWDADTVPLRPMQFFDVQGRMLLTRASEFHPPYFDTYRRLFGSDPHRECSFIAQHMLMQKSVVREMLAEIERRFPGPYPWPLKIMNVLEPVHPNLFSEYETYGHYIKNRYPDRVAIIERAWLRVIPQFWGRRMPSASELRRLAERYDYVSFERGYAKWRALKLWLQKFLGWPDRLR
ncbi:MAG: DUF6492 family protein [Verrucomicrobiae bacterium]|nr:DUF6492 family protein [Verrucomicrobiae bacterium]MDW7979900.1 DUF6492 family protein [Verrucomicrobiales bacterium]